MKEAITLSGVPETMLQPVYARAMLKNAPIIILDEATANVDPENEVVIQKAVARLVANKMVIVIAHRLSTITGGEQHCRGKRRTHRRPGPARGADCPARYLRRLRRRQAADRLPEAVTKNPP